MQEYVYRFLIKYTACETTHPSAMSTTYHSSPRKRFVFYTREHDVIPI